MIRLGGQTTEPEFLIDTAAINRKYAAQRDNPHRTWTGVTQVDVDCAGEILKRHLYSACGRFIDAMRKRNWDLVGRLFVGSPHQARNDNGILLLGRVEYSIRGGFKFTEPLRPLRTEVPSGLVKRDPDHTITLAEAKKAL